MLLAIHCRQHMQSRLQPQHRNRPAVGETGGRGNDLDEAEAADVIDHVAFACLARCIDGGEHAGGQAGKVQHIIIGAGGKGTGISRPIIIGMLDGKDDFHRAAQRVADRADQRLLNQGVLHHLRN